VVPAWMPGPSAKEGKPRVGTRPQLHHRPVVPAGMPGPSARDGRPQVGTLSVSRGLAPGMGLTTLVPTLRIQVRAQASTCASPASRPPAGGRASRPTRAESGFGSNPRLWLTWQVTDATTATDDYDSPWKEALERYLPDFLALLLPTMHAGIDRARGCVPLAHGFCAAMHASRAREQRCDSSR